MVELARAKVYVSGIVQGVFFRSSTRSMANMYGVKGWVRNTTDGGVEAVFEGTKEDVEKMIEYCRKGPVSAAVRMVNVKWDKYKGDLKGFEIKE